MFTLSKVRAVLIWVAVFWGLMGAILIPAAHAEEYLEPERAFQFSAKMLNPTTVAVTYVIADGYYMYRERFKFSAKDATLGAAKLPAGKVKFDETFSKDVETYRHTITIEIPVEAKGTFTLISTGQGCADLGLCYPPLDSEAKLTPPAAKVVGTVGDVSSGSKPAAANITSALASSGLASMSALVPASSKVEAATPPSSVVAPVVVGLASATAVAMQSPAPALAAAATDGDRSSSEDGRGALQGGKFLAILSSFFLLGLGLALTPCVLPMVPILSSIIVGEGTQVTRSRGFLLSAAYVLGMALVYTLLGVAAALVGDGLAAALQSPWILGGFGVLMVVLSLSMFGFYQLQMPAAIQMRLLKTSDSQAGGKLLGVFVMGAISALIVGPCVTAPLASALVYISQTRDVWVGGSALFAMAIGMGVPLLLVGVSAGTLLPKAGAWMESVSRFFGVLMLATALWMVTPILPVALQLLGWSVLCLGYGGFLLWSTHSGWLPKAAGLAFVLVGTMELLGVASGGRDATAPLAHVGRRDSAQALRFTRVKSVAELDAALAQNPGKTALLDFYADWCVSCKEMEKFTFSDPAVQAKFANTLLLQADVTVNSADDKALLKRFTLFGPPGIILFDKQGREMAAARVIGYQNAEKFLTSLRVLGN